MEVIALFILLMAISIHFPRREGPAKIKRRDGGSPVIEVTFNDKQKFDMVLDTGASQTCITQNMAKKLGVKTIGTVEIETAGQPEKVGVGYVDSIEVGGAKVDKPTVVLILNPNQRIGLLGQNFYRDYDIIIKSDVVEFRE